MAMTRWNFIGVLSGAALWPLAGHAQQSDRMRRLSLFWRGAEPWGRNAAARHYHASRRAAEWPVRGSRKLGLEPLIC